MRYIDVIRELEEFGIDADEYDPLASEIEVEQEHNIKRKKPVTEKNNAVMLAVAHDQFISNDPSIHSRDSGRET